MENGIRESRSGALVSQAEGIRGFVEELGIHVVLEVSLVGFVDTFLNNTVLSMLVGVCLVEGCQFLWRKWRKED
jgi:hypothetical protein